MLHVFHLLGRLCIVDLITYIFHELTAGCNTTHMDYNIMQPMTVDTCIILFVMHRFRFRSLRRLPTSECSRSTFRSG